MNIRKSTAAGTMQLLLAMLFRCALAVAGLVLVAGGSAAAAMKADVGGGGNVSSVMSVGQEQRTPALVAKEKGAKYKEDEILVKFKEGTTESQKDQLHMKHGASKLKDFKTYRLHLLKLKTGQTVEQAIADYKAEPDVEYAEPNFRYELMTTPNDPDYSKLWGMAKINAPAAWNSSTGSNSVVIGIIDTGIDYTHPDLAANVWVNPGETKGDGIDNDANGYVDDIYGIDTYNHDTNPFDDYGHGTHVAGTIGAQGNNGIGVVGVNWNVKMASCKFLGANGSGYGTIILGGV